MGTWGNLMQVLFIALALLAGESLATQGIVQGRAVGGLDLTILGRRLVLSTQQVYAGKVWYRACVIASA